MPATGSGPKEGTCEGPAALLLSTATPLAVANLPTRATSCTPGLRTLSAPGAAPDPGWEDKKGPRAGSESRGRRGRFQAAPCAPPARRACPSAGARGAGGRALAGGGPAGPRASPGTRPCHSHDAQPPGTASGARSPLPRVGGGRDDPGWGGRPAPRRAGPALLSRAPTARRAPESPRDSAVAAGAGPREGGAGVSVLPCSPGPVPPGTRGAGRAAGLASLYRPRRAGSGSGWWMGLVLSRERVTAPGRRLPRVPGACCTLCSSRASGRRAGPGEAQVRGGFRVTEACLAFKAAFSTCHEQLRGSRIP